MGTAIAPSLASDRRGKLELMSGWSFSGQRKRKFWERGSVVLLAGIMFGLAEAAAASPPVYTITQIGLTGSNYTIGASGAFSQSSSARAFNAAGDVLGNSERSSNSLGDLGTDEWIYNGNATVQVGLIGANYSYATSSGTYQTTANGAINDTGEVTGNTNRYSSSGNSLGLDAWFYNGQSTRQIGLTGAGYSYPTTGGIYEYNYSYGINDLGTVVGGDFRYSSDGTELGLDCWIFNGTSTQQIGLMGPQYSSASSEGMVEFIRSSPIQLPINAVGDVVGESELINGPRASPDYDQWFYNGTTSQQIGLIGANYSFAGSGGTLENSTTVELSATGDVIGTSNRYSGSSNTGDDSWIFNGTMTQQIGLIGSVYSSAGSSGVNEASQPLSINSAGDVIGVSYRYGGANATLGALGRDAWYYNGVNSQAIGLTDANHSFTTSSGTYEFSEPSTLNEAGQAAGTSDRFNSSGVNLGLDSWFFYGKTTQQIGVTGEQDPYAMYSVSGGNYQYSGTGQMNDIGDVTGTSYRYTSLGSALGQDAWLFDPTLDKTFMLQFSVDSANEYSSTTPEFLTDSGAVLGYYELYDGSIDEGSHVFYWDESDGFTDLGALVIGGLSATGWQDLATINPPDALNINGSGEYITGDGLLVGQSAGQTTFLMSLVVPEPRNSSLIVIVGVGLLMRWPHNRLKAKGSSNIVGSPYHV